MRTTLAELKRTVTEPYPENVWTAKVIRPLSCYPTWLFLRLKITANQATITSLLVGLGGCATLALGYFVVGALLINISYLLDRIDGNIARITGTSSILGRLIDGFTDFLLDALVPVSIGIGLYHYPQLGIPSSGYLLLGLTFSGIRMLRSRCAAYTSIVLGESAYKVVSGESIVLRVGLLFLSVEPVVLLICAVGNIMWLFLLGYTALSICALCAYTILAIKRAERR